MATGYRSDWVSRQCRRHVSLQWLISCVIVGLLFAALANAGDVSTGGQVERSVVFGHDTSWYLQVLTQVITLASLVANGLMPDTKFGRVVNFVALNWRSMTAQKI